MISSVPTWPRTIQPVGSPENRAILTAIYDLAGRGPMVDLGCGEAHVTRDFESTLVDILPRDNGPTNVLAMDVREFPDSEFCAYYNLCHMGDVIEHLTEGDGLALLAKMAVKANSLSIFTPVGPWCIKDDPADPHAHKSAWHPETFKAMGWEVWEFPSMHRFPDGVNLGAFWAWTFAGRQYSVAEVAAKAGLSHLLQR